MTTCIGLSRDKNNKEFKVTAKLNFIYRAKNEEEAIAKLREEYVNGDTDYWLDSAQISVDKIGN